MAIETLTMASYVLGNYIIYCEITAFWCKYMINVTKLISIQIRGDKPARTGVYQYSNR